MKFVSLELENFLSHRSTKLDLDNKGLVLIKGIVEGDPGADSNGAGKSALLPDGLLWVLFGKTLRGLKGQDVVHHRVGRNCVGTLMLEADSGQTVQIQRVQKHSKIPRASVQIEGKTLWGTEEVDKFVLEQLGLKFETLVPTTIFGKGDNQFFTQLPDAARKQILEDLLGLGELVDFQQVAKLRQAKLVDEESKLARAVRDLEVRIETTDQHLIHWQQLAKDFDAKKQAEIDKYTNLYKQLKEQLEAKTAGFEQLKEAKAKCVEATRQQTEKTNSALQELHTLQETHREKVKATHALDMLKIERATRLGTASKTLEENSKCPVCQQQITTAARENALSPLQREAQSAAAAAKIAEESVKQHIKLVEVALEKFDSANTLLEQCQKEEKKASDCVEQLENTICLVQTDIKNVADALELEKSRPNAAAQEMEKIQVQQKELKSLWSDALAQQRATQNNIPYADFWVEAFSNRGIKSLLLDRAVPLLNERAAHYAQLLTNGAIKVEFSTQTTLRSGSLREKFDVAVSSLVGGHTYRSCSDGQRRRGDLICNLALGDLAATRIHSPINIAVLDEVFDGLDACGIEMVMPMLSKLMDDRSSVFVISHNNNVANYFPTVLTIMNENGFSYLRE